VEESESSDEEEETAQKTPPVESKTQVQQLNGLKTIQKFPQIVSEETKQVSNQKVADLPKKKKKEDQKNVPFQRVKPEFSQQLDKRMFASQRNANSEWAGKADETLKKSKRKGFST